MNTQQVIVTFASSVLCGPYIGTGVDLADMGMNEGGGFELLDARVDVFSARDPLAVQAAVSVKLLMNEMPGEHAPNFARAHLDAVAKAVFPRDLHCHMGLAWVVQEVAELEGGREIDWHLRVLQ